MGAKHSAILVEGGWRHFVAARHRSRREGQSRGPRAWLEIGFGGASIGGFPLCLLRNIRIPSGGDRGRMPPNSGRQRDSLITAEISLIADLNSLQGRKKFPVPMRRELARKHLVQSVFLVPLMRRRARIDEIPCNVPASREFRPSETGSLETASSSGESPANLTSSIRR